ncbi:unnamed protein product [Closterium sp. NIES-65]|nr:unnamed protein product [Closterium sp. NIES-65]
MVEGCGSKKKREMRVDLIIWETLEESPLLVLPCQHAFTVESLDNYLGLSQVYQESKGNSGGCSAVGGDTEASAGKWVVVRPFESSLSALKRCPDSASQSQSCDVVPSRQLEELGRAASFLVEEASNVRGTALDPPTQQTVKNEE